MGAAGLARPRISCARELRDGRDNAKTQTRLVELVDEMAQSFLCDNVHRHSISVEAYKQQGPNASRENKEYFREFRELYLNLLKDQVEVLIRRKQDWDRDGGGIGLPGECIDELLHHCLWAKKKWESFHGRDNLLKKCLAKVLRLQSHLKWFFQSMSTPQSQ